MGIRSRLTLLMFTGILGKGPPVVVPGFNMTPAEPATCPKCGKKSTAKVGNRYRCRDCGHWFTPGETANSGES